MATSLLDRDIQFLKGVGPRRAELFQKLGLSTARELLYHTPRRYEDASTVHPISSLETGMDVTVIGTVVSKGVLPTRRGLKIFQAVIRDPSGLLECAWPGQPFLDRVIKKGDLLLVTGPVRFFHGRQLQPREYTILASGEADGPDVGKVFPIYPATEGLGHRQIRSIVDENLPELLTAVEAEEFLPDKLLSRAATPPLGDALRMMHQPASSDEAEQGRRRLALEELFLLQLLHARNRWEILETAPGISFPRAGARVRALNERLPFELTGAQKRVLREIGEDMGAPRRMNRLLQGDVGSGKTIVALFAALRAIDDGYQAAIMAPTEILAEQHLRSIRRMLDGVDVSVGLHTGRLSGAARKQTLGQIASGEMQLVIGTHALIQESVDFRRLGLAIVDEQHRFGVRQRLALSEMGSNPDTLVMSATPIPRSLALTLYGDLDISVLDERPPGRQPIRTALRKPRDLGRVLDFVHEQVKEGRQAYIVYPLVGESETLDLKSATEEYQRLQGEVFPDLRIALLHGQMPGEEKEAIMRRFADGEVDVLVATTVIEVGIDVPNATVMVIEHAERFGLSQLHQLRGRVGRGSDDSYCILISDWGGGIERLRVFAQTEDGFAIAEADLRIRGQGDLFGARQSGVPELRWADLERDLDLLELGRDWAREIVDRDPDLEKNQPVRAALARRHTDHETLFRTG